MKKKHENMTHDPSNHLIILHRNFVALKRSWHFSFYLTLLSSVFWLLNVVIRAHRGANLATLLPWIHIRDVYLAVAAKVKNNFWKIIFISLVRNSVKTRLIRKFDRNSNFFKAGFYPVWRSNGTKWKSCRSRFAVLPNTAVKCEVWSVKWQRNDIWVCTSEL